MLVYSDIYLRLENTILWTFGDVLILYVTLGLLMQFVGENSLTRVSFDLQNFEKVG